MTAEDAFPTADEAVSRLAEARDRLVEARSALARAARADARRFVSGKKRLGTDSARAAVEAAEDLVTGLEGLAILAEAAELDFAMSSSGALIAKLQAEAAGHQRRFADARHEYSQIKQPSTGNAMTFPEYWDQCHRALTHADALLQAECKRVDEARLRRAALCSEHPELFE